MGPWKVLDSQKTGRDLQLLRSCFGLPGGNLGELWILRGNCQLFRSCFGLPRGNPYTVVDYNHNIWGAGIAQWLERRTLDRKVAGSNPCWSSGRIFFSRVNFLCWILFRYPFHPRVTAVARKRPRSFCQKCRWQVTAKHAYTLRMWLSWSDMVHGCYGVHRKRRDGSSFMWHQPCQRCKYTTLLDIKKRVIKRWSLMQNHMRAQRVCSRAENSAI